MGSKLVQSNPLALPKSIQTITYTPQHPEGVNPNQSKGGVDWAIVCGALAASLVVSVYFNLGKRRDENVYVKRNSGKQRHIKLGGLLKFIRPHRSEAEIRRQQAAEHHRRTFFEQLSVSAGESGVVQRRADGGAHGNILATPRSRHPVDSALGSWDRRLRAQEQE